MLKRPFRSECLQSCNSSSIPLFVPAPLSACPDYDLILEDNAQIRKLSASHPLHKLWTLSRDSETTLFELRQVQRDENHPSTSIDVPSSCLVLEVENWIEELQPDSSFSGVLVRQEYREALRALMEWFLEGTSDIPTEIAVGEDAMQVDDVLSSPFPNPFFDHSPDSRPTKGAFVLLGHPGIGEQSLNRDYSSL